MVATLGRVQRGIESLYRVDTGVAVAEFVIDAAARDQLIRSRRPREQLIAAAREIMTAQHYCAFITVDKEGRAQVRTVNPFPPDENMVVWFATRDNTRKAQEIRDNPHVVVYYADHGAGTGYVALSGRAELVTDKVEIQKRHRAYWDQAFPGQKGLVLVKIVPEHLEVINYKAGTKQDSVTWRAPNFKM